MGKVVEFQRESLGQLLEEVAEKGAQADGVVAIVYRRDGGASFRISGFQMKGASFLLAGLLDWIKADLMTDIT